MIPPARSGGFTLRTTCNRCGQPLPLNAPVQKTTCAACSADVALPDGLWTTAFDELEKRYQNLTENVPTTETATIDGFPLTFEYRRAPPRCEKCSQPYPEDRTTDGSQRDLFCVGCGDPASTYPVPAWLRRLVPAAAQITSTDPGGAAEAGIGPAGGLAAAPRQSATPVLMTCPQCGGPLRITDEMGRLVPCEHCHAEVYLPDELWRRLHPVKVARLWYVRFEGKPRWQAAAEAEERSRQAWWAREREAREERTAREREMVQAEQQRLEALAEEDARGMRVAVAPLVSRAYVMVGVAFFVLAATSIWGLASAPSSGLAALHTPVGVGLLVASFITLLAALGFAGSPIKRRTGYDSGAMVFVVWFYAIFGFAMPVVGQIMCLVVAFKRFGGEVGGSMGEINGSPVTAPVVQLSGESVPLGLVYLLIALMWPAAIASIALAA